jgi:hypothetical protein
MSDAVVQFIFAVVFGYFAYEIGKNQRKKALRGQRMRKLMTDKK